MKKRGVSPLIATILLIAFVVILFASVQTWVRRAAIEPEPEVVEEYNPCVSIKNYERVEEHCLPKNITIDDNIVIDFNEISIDKFNIFDLSEKVEKLANGIIDFNIYDENDWIIYDSKNYIRCGMDTINKLIELNATDLIYDVCVKLPEIEKVQIRANFNVHNEEHKVVVCWE